jgi:hypothetical protein
VVKQHIPSWQALIHFERARGSPVDIKNTALSLVQASSISATGADGIIMEAVDDTLIALGT